VKVLQIAHSSVSIVGKAEQECSNHITNRVLIPLNYLGKYLDCFKVTLNNRTVARDALLQAIKDENECKRQLEMIQNNPVVASNLAGPDASEARVVREESINRAKLGLVEAENKYESKKSEEEVITKSIRNECRRLEDMQRKRILVSILAMFDF
jgi:hypothetical protein